MVSAHPSADTRAEKAAGQEERLVVSCVAGSLILILLLAMWIPDSLAHSEGTMAHSAMTASLIGGSAFSGYIVMGILSFLLGVCVTILLYRLHRHFRDRKEEQDEF